MTQIGTTPPPHRTRGWAFAGLLAAAVALGGIGAWTVTTSIDGAVVAPARIAVETNRKAVQHFEGGIVRQVLVKDGDLVQEGEVLVRLDTTRDRGELVALLDKLAHLNARRARMRAELEGEDSIAWPEMLVLRAKEPRIAAVINAQNHLFRSRHAARQAEERLLRKRAGAFRAQIDGLAKRQIALKQELELNAKEDEMLTPLVEKTLVRMPRVMEVRRKMARLESQLAADAGEALSLMARIEETEAQGAQVTATFLEEVAARLIETQAEIAELEERKAALKDRLMRRDVRAPQTGRVLNLAVHAPGAVIASGERLLEIVPADDDLVLRARVPAGEVERVAPGLPATVRLTAFNLNSTPELVGTVETVAADADRDAESEVPYYAATVRLGADQLARLEGATLTPGMPAEVLIRTGERLVASYFMRPLADHYTRAFRDE